MGHKPRSRLLFELADFDHARERFCDIDVSPAALTATFRWDMEINQDYIHPDDDDPPRPVSHSESIAFDSGDDLARFVDAAIRELVSNCYSLYIDRSASDDIDGALADLGNLTTAAIPGNAMAHKVGVADLERAYGQRLPAPLRDFLTGPAWRALDKKTALDLPGEIIDGELLGLDQPAVIDFLGQSLVDNAALYRKPGMCAFAKFLGQGLGMTYYGVVQAEAGGDILITTGLDDVHCIAESPEELAGLLAEPGKIRRKGRIRRVASQ